MYGNGPVFLIYLPWNNDVEHVNRSHYYTMDCMLRCLDGIDGLMVMR